MRNSKKLRKGPSRLTASRTQRQVLCDVMLSAGQCNAWYTLQELAHLTRYGEASISAQLRHLRKPENGGYLVAKRVRKGAVVRGREMGFLWEYQLRREIPATWSRTSIRGYGEHLAVQPAVC